MVLSCIECRQFLQDQRVQHPLCLDPVKLRKALKNGARWVLHHYLKRGSSSVGRAIAFQAISRRFEPGLPLNSVSVRSDESQRRGPGRQNASDPAHIRSHSRVGYNAALSRRRSGVRIPLGPQTLEDWQSGRSRQS